MAVGEDTKIGERTFVSQSVIGSRCTIGNDVHINNAYIWDDVEIKVRHRAEVKICQIINYFHLE